MKHIVSITPIRVEADSRTFKQAASIARFGYTSIVVEGVRSEFDRAGLPFNLLSVGQETREGDASKEAIHHSSASSCRRGILNKSLGVRRLLTRSRLKPLIQFIGYLLGYLFRYCYQPLRIIPPASLYYLHSPLQFPAIYIVCKRYRAKYIYDAHDFYTGMGRIDQDSPALERWQIKFNRLVESICVRNAAAVVTVNEGIAALLREEFGCNAYILHNSHDDRLDRETTVPLRQTIGASEGDIVVAIIGQAKPGQAMEQTLFAMTMLPQTSHLVLLGRGYEVYDDRIRELGLRHRVHHLEPVMPYEVVPFIRSADASLIVYYAHAPTYENSLPNRFFQSVAAELPLLYPALPQIERLAKHYQLGISIDPHNSESIASAVLTIMNDVQLQRRLKSNLQAARQELRWESDERTLRSIVDGLIGGPSSPARSRFFPGTG